MMEWLRLLIDDILRFSKEKNRPVSIREIMEETNSNKIEVMDAIKEMEKEGLAEYEENLSLTEKGEKIASEVYERHKTIEEFFGGEEAHEIAHSLEHFLRKKDIETMKDMLTKRKESIDKFEEGERGIIVAFAINDPKIISRLIGTGLAPLTPFIIEKKRGNEMLLSVHNKLVAVDKILSKRIYAIEMET